VSGRAGRLSALLVAALAACKPDSTTGTKTYQPPPPSVDLRDPQGILDAIGGFESTFGLSALHSATGFAAFLSVPSAPPAPGAAGAPACAAGLPPAAPAATFGVFPDSDLGRVFVYDSATRRFVTGADTGGPAGGVEFVLPALDVLNQVTYPLQTAGTLTAYDVTPPGGLTTLHTVVSGGGASADYTFADSGTATAYAGFLSGWAGGAGKTYGFQDSTTGLYLEVTAAAILVDSTTGVRMSLNASRTATDAFDNYYDLDYTFRWTGGKVRLLGAITTYCLLPSIGLTVSVNDTDYAIVNQGQSGPVVTALDSALTPTQDSAIQALIRGQSELFSWLTALTQPARQFLGP